MADGARYNSIMSATLQIDALTHAYGPRTVLRSVSLHVGSGEVACLLGPSGCGKTTLLRCVAGFEPAAAGRILLDDVVLSKPGFVVPPERRRIGMVFQDYALFPHLSVQANIAFGLHTLSAGEARQRVGELLDAMRLDTYAARYPHELSGGQQQRVALARALAPRPALLLLDEPFSNLDVALRETLSLEVRDILKQQKITAIMVTHDQHEAFNIADRIGILDEGRLLQWGTPYDLYHEPATRFVADFIGQGSFLPGTVIEGGQVQLELGAFPIGKPSQWLPGTRVEVLLRPDDILHDDDSPLRAYVLHKAFRGAHFLYTLQLPGGGKVLSLSPSHHDHAVGEPIGVRLEIDHIVAFEKQPPVSAPHDKVS
jgi:iron(III) transport system ATP-binding protein